MKATLNLRKADLRTKLVERTTEITAYYDGKRTELQEVIDERASASDDTSLHAEWYETLAAGLRDGSITLNASTGKLKNAPAKPGTKAARGSLRRGDWNYYSTEQLEERKGQYDESEKQEIKPVQTAIDLLDLATDEVVEIDTTDYHNLLNGSRNRHW